MDSIDNSKDSILHAAVIVGTVALNVFRLTFTPRELKHKNIRLGKEDVLELLINRGANVNVTDQSGATPLHKTAGHGKC